VNYSNTFSGLSLIQHGWPVSDVAAISLRNEREIIGIFSNRYSTK
jgi:hypothetical protein